MNIDDLTIGQAREQVKLFPTGGDKTAQLDNGMTGKYVIVRCRDAGVHAGVLESYSGRECVLTEARRLWYHRPAEKSSSWYEGVSIHGLSADSKISDAVARRHLTENCDIIECTEKAQTSIREAKTHEQS